MVIGVRRRRPRSPSDLADAGSRPEFTPIESQVSRPRHKLAERRRGFFFAERANLGSCGHQAIGQATARSS